MPISNKRSRLKISLGFEPVRVDVYDAAMPERVMVFEAHTLSLTQCIPKTPICNEEQTS